MTAFLSRIGFLLTTILLLTHCRAMTYPVSKTTSVCTFQECSIFDGLVSKELEVVIKGWLDERLASSTQSVIKSVWRVHWIPFCSKYGLSDFVPSGCTTRGGIMASFVAYMGIKGLCYNTITNYLWAVVDKHKENGYGSPLGNIRDWNLFMRSVQVECHVPSEPRKMVPWKVICAVIKACDQDSMAEIAVCLFLIISLFTGIRPEVLPKTRASFSTAKHFAMSSYRVVNGHFEVWVTGIKQDPLNLRPAGHFEKEGKGVWRVIGSTLSPLFSVICWMNRYLPHRCKFPFGKNTPLFVNPTGHPYTYDALQEVFRQMQRRIDMLWNYTFGGIRSTFYVAVSTLFGSEHAREIGLWAGDCCKLYDRPWMERTLSIPQKMAQLACGPDMPAGGMLEQLAERLDSVGVEGGTRPAKGVASTSAAVPVVLLDVPADKLLAGWDVVSHAHSNGSFYYTFKCIRDGFQCRSRLQARAHDRNFKDDGLSAWKAVDDLVAETAKLSAPSPCKRRKFVLGVCANGKSGCVRGDSPHTRCAFI